MAATVDQLTRDALSLSEVDRASLAQTLLRSLESEVEEDVADAWDEEIGRRLSAVREGTASGRPASEVFKDIRTRYGQ